MRRTEETEERTEGQRAREERGDSRMRGGMDGPVWGGGGVHNQTSTSLCSGGLKK